MANTYRTNIHELFLHLVRLGTGNAPSFKVKVPESIDWKQVKALTERQGLSAIMLDGINAVYGSDVLVHDSIPQMLRLEWIGEVLQNYEARYKQYEKAIGSLAGWYNQHGFKMMVLKGYGLSLNYPNPSHRPCGDIDIWLFGQQREADTALGSWFKVQGTRSGIDTSHHHHTLFEWEGFTVENHYDFINVHYGHKNAALEKVFKEQAQDDSNFVEINGEKVYLPSANLHALFLLRHCMQDFASAEMNLRQVLDWGFFVEKHTNEIDWNWLNEVLKEYNMTDFVNCLNAICVGNLGFHPAIFGTVQFNPELKDKVFNDIMNPSFGREEPRELFKRLVYKYRRWKGNAWKQELCYGDSRWRAFWTGVWNHMLKPKSI